MYYIIARLFNFYTNFLTIINPHLNSHLQLCSSWNYIIFKFSPFNDMCLLLSFVLLIPSTLSCELRNKTRNKIRQDLLHTLIRCNSLKQNSLKQKNTVLWAGKWVMYNLLSVYQTHTCINLEPWWIIVMFFLKQTTVS